MIKIENIDVWGFEHAIRAMRNPMNSWDKSDSDCNDCSGGDCESCWIYVGKNDLDLMKRLFKAGTEHRTYARMIQVSMDITAPLYWWKEMDRYTVGKSQVSCSTMHKIADKEFTMEDFSCEHLTKFNYDQMKYLVTMVLNANRDRFKETKNKDDWWQLIQMLPSSYNQKRTICMSYETVFKIIKERTGHKLDEWDDFVKELKALPYVKEIMGEAEDV